jgi:hypothetical protein
VIDPATLPPQVAKLLGPSPSTVLYELDQIFGGETAVYLRRGVLMPELTIVTQPNDVHAAEESLAEVLKAVKTSSQLDLVHAVIGGQLVISTSPKGIEDFRSGGDKLSSDSMFQDAQKAVGMPDETTGFLYVDAKDAVPLVQAFGPLLGLKLPPLLAKADLSALRTLTAYGDRTGDRQSSTVYLQVQ